MRKHLPNSCDFWENYNSYCQNIYMLSERRYSELGHVIFISLEWEMRAEKRETNQVPSALLNPISNCSPLWDEAVADVMDPEEELKILKTKTMIISKPYNIFKNWIHCQ